MISRQTRKCAFAAGAYVLMLSCGGALAVSGNDATLFGGEDSVGARLVGAEGAVIGDVADVLNGGPDGQARLVVQTDGFLGLGRRYVMVPVTDVRVAGEVLVSKLTVDDIEALKTYTRSGDWWVRAPR